MLLLDSSVITYDRNWVLEYADKANYQRVTLQILKTEIFKLQYNALPEEQPYIYSILSQIEVLEQSLKITEDTIRQYIDNVEESVLWLQLQLR